MPIREYICLKCKHEFEVIQKMTDSEPLCPKCKGKTERQMSLGSFRLSGDGWAEDGYSKGEK